MFRYFKIVNQLMLKFHNPKWKEMEIQVTKETLEN